MMPPKCVEKKGKIATDGGNTWDKREALSWHFDPTPPLTNVENFLS